jgi:hypothetical protein
MRVTSSVRQALRQNEQARSSDRVLLLQVWHDLGLDLTPAQQMKFLEIPPPETIRRIRQKLQEAGEYPATKSVTEAREFKSYAIQQNAPSAKPKRMEELLSEQLCI